MEELPNIKWRKSEARNIILDDLLSGVLPNDPDELSAEMAWNLCYVHMEEFRRVPFSQFKARLKDHRKQFNNKLERSLEEEQFLVHDRGLVPRRSMNDRCKIVFNLHPAKELLRQDIANGRHKHMTPLQLQNTTGIPFVW